MGFLAPTHIFLILLVAILVFGPNKLPEMARSLGKGVKEFKDQVSEVTGMDANSINEMKQSLSPTNIVRSAIPTEVREVMGEDVRQTELAAQSAPPAPAAADFVPERHKEFVAPDPE